MMKMARRGLVGGVAALAAASCLWARDAAFEKAPYMDPKLSVEDRMEDLVSRMSLVEKVAQLSTTAGFGMYDITPARKVKSMTYTVK